MNDFLEAGMKKINSINEYEIEVLKERFERMMKLSYSIFGKENFLLLSNDKKNNLSIIFYICFFIDDMRDDFIEKNKEKIKENYKDLISQSTYTKSLISKANTSRDIQQKINKAKTILSNV
ncbi:hypothetical protein ACE193_01530 [Bernardetia sp. OM2101]|uniref:hypothetical protein n=1 Tax=Bernardetia sp. OM2101 TaxID=3344876 RepID=UPI0035CEC14D